MARINSRIYASRAWVRENTEFALVKSEHGQYWYGVVTWRMTHIAADGHRKDVVLARLRRLCRM